MNGVASPILGQERGREYARSIYFIYSFYQHTLMPKSFMQKLVQLVNSGINLT